MENAEPLRPLSKKHLLQVLSLLDHKLTYLLSSPLRLTQLCAVKEMPGDTGALPSLLVNSTAGVWVSHTELLSTARTGETVSSEHMKSRNKRKSHRLSLPPIRPRDWVRAGKDSLQSFHRIKH